jgi:hypothetical protein
LGAVRLEKIVGSSQLAVRRKATHGELRTANCELAT